MYHNFSRLFDTVGYIYVSFRIISSSSNKVLSDYFVVLIR